MTVLFGCAVASVIQPGHAGEVTPYYEIALDSQKVIVSGEATTNVLVAGKRVSVSARETDFKKFNDGTVSFLFPSGYTVEKKEDDALTAWSLDGNHNVVTVYRLKGLPAAEFCSQLAREVEKGYGKAAQVTESKCSFGTNVVKGTRITVNVLEHRIVQELYPLAACRGDYAFVIQESGETPSAEDRLMKEKLKETFSCQPAASP